MNGLYTLRAVCLALVLSPVLQARNLDELRPVILVRMYNLASVPNLTLRDAQDYATEIFRRSGVEISWRDIGDSLELNAPVPGTVELRIMIRAHALKPLIQKQETMGIQLNDVRADIIYDQVRSFASTVSSTAAFPPLVEPIILGHVIAHEIGHLMRLPHSNAGIMRARWDAFDFRLHGAVELHFTEEESQRLRAELIRRIRK